MTGFFESDGSSRVATTAPTAADDATRGYSPGFTWTDSVTSTVYYCISVAIGAAVWGAAGAGSTGAGVFATTGYFGLNSFGATSAYGSFTSNPGSIV